jgi:hypothetical protein
VASSIQDLLHLRPRHGELVDVLSQPPAEILLDAGCPGRVDLPGGVLAFAQPLMAEENL